MKTFCNLVLRFAAPMWLSGCLLLAATMLLAMLMLSSPYAQAQSEEMTVVVLVDSTNTLDYNTSHTSPGTYQVLPERYLEHLQIPYRVVDISTTPAQDLTATQLIIAGHHGLHLSSDWQNAITTAVSNGTGFVNLDNDVAIGQQTHIQQIFGATGSALGSAQQSITIPAAVLPGGSTPHYIAALQKHWLGDPAGDITYTYHGNGSVVIPSSATVLQGAHGTVVATLGTDPLILATTYGKGRAVDFTTYDYLHADRFGFVMGVDDLFWRSLVWAARKPFVLRGYPRFVAIQMDDNEPGWLSRLPDLWNTALTGTTAADGTGGPWNPQGNLQLSSLGDPGGERAQLIQAVKNGNVRVSPHGLNYGSGGDLYWNLTVANTDAQWQTNVQAVQTWKTGQGGSDTFPAFNRSMVAHYWDISNNSGYEMWTNLGLRYITTPQMPGAYYFTSPKPLSQRMGLRPFRIYEQPPVYSGDVEETFPFFYADDLTVGSRQGLPAKTFFAFASQVGTEAGRFTRPDALFPSTQNSYSVSQSLNQWEYYTWRFWSGMAPVEIYTHDGANLEFTSTSNRQTFVQQMSQWFNSNGARHAFMDSMGDYMRARNHSLLSTASISNQGISLNFTGAATDADGNLIGTKTYIFYGDDEGTLLDVPGFANGATYTYPNTQPATLQIDPVQISVTALPGATTPPTPISVANVGSGSFSWTVTSNAPWLTTSTFQGVSNATVNALINSASLANGSYSGALTFTAAGAANSPKTVPVLLTIAPPSLVAAPVALQFNGTINQPAPAAQLVRITNSGGGTLGWQASSDSAWLSVSSGSGQTPGSLMASVNAGSLSLGNYAGNIKLHATGASIPDVMIPVSFQLEGPIDTPSTSSLSGWTISPIGNPAAWTSSGGAIHFNGTTESELYTGSSAWTDYDVEVGLALSRVADYPGGIRARVNPATGSGYALWMYPSENTLTLFSVQNWNISSGYTVLGSATGIGFDTNTHKLKLGVHGNLIQAYYDGKLVLTVTDSTYSSGMIALDPSTQTLSYSSVVVNSSISQQTGFTAAPASLSFSAIYNGANPSPQNLTLSATPGNVSWSATASVPWLTVTPTGSTTPSTVSVSVNSSTMAAGKYSGAITLTPSAGSAIQVPVTLTVSVATPSLLVAPTGVSLTAYTGQPAPKAMITIANQSGSAFQWTASSDQPWLAISPGSGSAAATVTVTPAVSTLSQGTYTAHITVAAPSLPNSPVVVPVILQVNSATLSDSFLHNALGWIISPNGLGANFSVANQVYSYSGGGNTQSCSGSGSYGDYEFDFGMRLQVASDYPGGVRAHVNPFTGAGYGLWFYPSEQVVKLLNITGWPVGSPAVIAQAPAKLDTAWHSYRFVFSGAQISAYQDGMLLLTATDPSYTAGYVCFDPSDQPVSYNSALVLSSTPAATLTPSPTSLSFSSPNTGANPPSQTLSLATSYGVTYGAATDVPWLTVQTSSATTPATLTVSVNSSNLANGAYTGHITLGSPGSGNAPITIPVSLSLASAVINLAPPTVDIFGAVGATLPPFNISVQNLGTGMMAWTASSDSSWLTLSPASASAPGTLVATPQTTALPTGNQLAHVTASSNSAANGSATLPVTVHLGTLVFSDTFASGSAQWTPSPLGLATNWSVSGNAFRYNGNGHTQQYAGNQNWANYVVSTGITLSSLSDYPGGLRGRVNLSNGASYAAWLYPAEHVIKLFRVTGWNIDSSGLTLLGQSANLPMDTQLHQLRLSFNGSQIAVYYDNAQVVSANDSTYPTGAIALDVSSQPIAFSNVSVLQQ